MTASTHQNLRGRSKLSAGTAILLARLCWGAFLFVPFSVLFWLFWHSADQQVHSRLNEERWFIAAMVYLVLAAPAACFWRERIFEDYRASKIMSPVKYLVGMITVWLVLVTAGLFSLVGCIVFGTLLPNLVPAFLAWLLFLMLWPTGRSMVQSIGRQKNLQMHEEP